MEKGDIGSVAEIEQAELSAWSSSLIEAEFSRAGSTLLAAVVNNRIIGWCCARVAGNEAELLKIGVAPGFRRRSVGTGLLSSLMKTLEVIPVDTLFLEVRSRNETALGFYERLGFTPVGRRINYYSQPVDDALILSRNMQDNSF